jgi:D-threo-aldose 1-dehydrogenase
VSRTTTDLDLGHLGYGAANLGNLYRAMTEDEAWQVLDAAWESGIRHFDTAPHYGLGLSERRLGRFLSTKPRADYTVTTKVGRLLRPDPDGADRMDDANDFVVPAEQTRVWDVTADGLRRSLEESLDRLGLDAVDVAYLHDPERYDLRRCLDEGLPGLASLRDEGLVRAVGVGSMSTEALLATVRTGTLDLLMVAGRYTLADQAAAVEVLPECGARKVGVVAAAVFNSGLLAEPSPSPTSRYDYGPVPLDLLNRVHQIEAICAEYGVPLPVAALRFPLSDPVVRSVVAGAATPGQVQRNAAAMAAEVPAELWQRLRDDGLVAR